MDILKAVVENVDRSIEVISGGGVIIYPTDTVYGIGCDPFKVVPLRRILKIKGKRRSPLPILASTIEQVKRVVFLSRRASKVVEYFWPGGLTAVLPSRVELPFEVTRGRKSIGIRVPKNEFTKRLLEASGGLLIGTSANKSGSPPPTTLEEVVKGIGGEADLIFDGGETELKKHSTVVDLTGERIRKLREGAVSSDDILNVAGRE